MYIRAMTRKLLFIVNPKAGKKLGQELLPFIEKKLEGKINFEVAIWKNINEFEQISAKLRGEAFTDAIAVGGDGTVNQVAKSILGTNICLGIIPTGSGNGLARSLGLLMKPELAIEQIIHGKTELIDSGTVNGIPFFCTSGVGFDAHIGNLFATSVKRGLKSYVKITVSELFKYRSKKYKLKFNGKEIERKAFFITVANAGQYGNDFYIAPGAKMNDGLFHVSILRPFKFYEVIGLLSKILRKKADQSKLIETITCSELTIEREEKDVIHFDGEPALTEKHVTFKCVPASLKVIVGEKYNAI